MVAPFCLLTLLEDGETAVLWGVLMRVMREEL